MSHVILGINNIIRYLKGTKDKGLILSLDEAKLQLDLYADADFLGFFTAKDIHDPISVKSPPGLIMNFGGVPIFWSSKPQSEIVLSILEAEYIALSQDMRELVAPRNLVLELKDQTNLELSGVGIVSKAWEDSIDTQNLFNSREPFLLARTKDIGIKYY